MKIPGLLLQLSLMKKLLLALFTLVLLVLFLLLILVLRTASGAKIEAPPPRLPMEQSGVVIAEEGPALMYLLIKPDLNFGVPEFPLKQERKTQYTEAEVLQYMPDFPQAALELLRRQRKDRLNEIFGTVD